MNDPYATFGTFAFVPPLGCSVRIVVAPIDLTDYLCRLHFFKLLLNGLNEILYGLHSCKAPPTFNEVGALIARSHKPIPASSARLQRRSGAKTGAP